MSPGRAVIFKHRKVTIVAEDEMFTLYQLRTGDVGPEGEGMK